MPTLRCLLLLCSLVSLFCIPGYGQVPYETGDWPQWRGPEANGISRETGLLKKWPEGGPQILWQVDSVGVGYSSIAVKSGRIYTLGDLDGVEHVICLDAGSGRTLWQKQPGPLADLLTVRIESEFKQLDRNKDGRIDEAEALARFGWDFTKYDRPIADADVDALAASRVEALLKIADVNSDGQLDFSEGAALFRDAFDRMDVEDKQADAGKLAASRTAAYVKDLDTNGDGRLSREEVRRTALDRHFGRIDQRDAATSKGDDALTADEIEQALLRFEPGRDGVVTRQELRSYYVSQKVNGDGELSPDELRGAFGGYRNGMGDGPRGTPTVDGDRLYVEGGNGDVACMNAETGETIWYFNLPQDFGGRTPGWGYSESPLIVEQLVIVTPGGQQGTIVALDKMSGSRVWQSSKVTEGAHYSTPVLATIGGVRQLVQFGNQSVFGVALDDGRMLWNYPAAANGTANCCSPIVDSDHVFASSAYGTGGGLVRITGSGETQHAEEVYFEKKLQCHHGGIVKIGDYLYTCGNGPLTCANFLTGEIVWQSRSVGKGSLVAADGMLYVLSEGHRVALVEATPEEYREHGTFEIASHGRPSWAHPVVAGGTLYLRDQNALTAYRIRE
ncbi:MAG: PQQ-binding-like beta-propeller repeat protein [Planctomycetaceae bacterium]|nr:PQQ-binding-like beta-propeller repeat protein [Planctomycetaceae bacterium]